MVVVGGCALYAAISGQDADGARPLWAVLGVIFVFVGLVAVRARVPASFDSANRAAPTTRYTVIGFVAAPGSTRLRRQVLSQVFGPDTTQIVAWLWTAGAVVSAVAVTATTDHNSLVVVLAILLAVIGLAFITLGATGGASVDAEAVRWRERLAGTAHWSQIVQLELAGGSVWRYLLDLPGYGPKKREIRVITSGGRPRAIIAAANSGPNNEREFVRALLGQAQQHGVEVAVTNRAAWAPVLDEIAPSLVHD